MKDDYEYFTESVGEQLFLILMTAVSTMTVVGIILAIALQKGIQSCPMMMLVVHNAVHHATSATWRKMMSEPRLEDDFALGKEDECDDCGNFVYECSCGEPDRMWGDE